MEDTEDDKEILCMTCHKLNQQNIYPYRKFYCSMYCILIHQTHDKMKRSLKWNDDFQCLELLDMGQ
jgi:hypothetical protein